MSNVLKLSTTAAKLSKTPFSPGFNATLANPAGTSITVQGSADGTTFTTLVTTADHFIEIKSLPNFIKLSAAGAAYLISGSTG